ncbi:MAG: C39 family peptidase, partial [Chloroflexota bacterium]
RPTDQPTARPLPPKAMLNLTHEYQKWNNCGPVSAAVVTTFFGIPRTQLDVAAEVKGGEFDKNVSPSELQTYLQSVGLRVLVRVNGSRESLMRLVAAGIPVIVQQWLRKDNGELVGHYRVVQGYDLSADVFVTSDPFTPPRKVYTFAEFEQFWQPWNHRYLVAYRAEQEAMVGAMLGDDVDERQNAQRALAASLAAIRANANDAHSFFNVGDDRLALGDAAGAVAAYDQAFALGLPAHFAWYNFGPFDALYQVGNYQRMLDLSAPMLKDAGTVEEIHFWRGKAYLALGDKQNARAELALAVQLNARYADARAMWERVR